MPSSLKAAGVRPTSPELYRGFAVITRMHLRRHFRAVRLLHEERLPKTETPLILMFNHASWWDPLLSIALQNALLPRRNQYCPMDAAALKQYGFFSRIGAFPIEMDSPRGAAQFLRGSQAVLANGDVLWISPQGAFVDVRQRPLSLKGGLGALLHRLAQATVVPVAMEYTFWDQRLPEALVCFGEPIRMRDGPSISAQEWTEEMTRAMTVTGDELAACALTRDAAHFHTLLEGARGTAGIYGVWQRVRSRLRGERYVPDHQARHAAGRKVAEQ